MWSSFFSFFKIFFFKYTEITASLNKPRVKLLISQILFDDLSFVSEVTLD